MNARFRIGNTYQFVTNSKDVYIVPHVLEYTGFKRGIYEFVHALKGYPQECPKEWLEDKEVGVINEWGKDGSLKVRD